MHITTSSIQGQQDGAVGSVAHGAWVLALFLRSGYSLYGFVFPGSLDSTHVPETRR